MTQKYFDIQESKMNNNEVKECRKLWEEFNTKNKPSILIISDNLNCEDEDVGKI